MSRWLPISQRRGLVFRELAEAMDPVRSSSPGWHGPSRGCCSPGASPWGSPCHPLLSRCGHCLSPSSPEPLGWQAPCQDPACSPGLAWVELQVLGKRVAASGHTLSPLNLPLPGQAGPQPRTRKPSYGTGTCPETHQELKEHRLDPSWGRCRECLWLQGPDTDMSAPSQAFISSISNTVLTWACPASSRLEAHAGGPSCLHRAP